MDENQTQQQETAVVENTAPVTPSEVTVETQPQAEQPAVAEVSSETPAQPELTAEGFKAEYDALCQKYNMNFSVEPKFVVREGTNAFDFVIETKVTKNS